MNDLIIAGASVVLPTGVLPEKNVLIRDGKIADIDLPDTTREGILTIDAKGLFLFAGFVDLHVHGGGGADFMDATPEAFETAVKAHLKHGTTLLYPTAMSASEEDLADFIKAFLAFRKSSPYAALTPGLHMEGPYFSGAQSGAQNPEYIKVPDPLEYLELLDDHGDIIRHWSFAPELEGAVAFCETLSRRGVRPSIGHSDAVFSEVEKVYEKGCRNIKKEGEVVIPLPMTIGNNTIAVGSNSLF
jgi:N-acetylglucosamine-6-phosphate deacetylase